VRQLADEADGIGGHHRGAPGEHDAPHRRIEGGEQLIGHVGIGAGERAEQRRFAGIGIADQCQ